MTLVCSPTQGWSSAYTMEALVLQIGATLVKGKARIVFHQAKVQLILSTIDCYSLSHSQGETYSLAKAQNAYKSLVKIHEKSGKLNTVHCSFISTFADRMVYATQGRGMNQIEISLTTPSYIVHILRFQTQINSVM